MAIRVTVWNEYLHEVQFPEIAEVYPKEMCIRDSLHCFIERYFPQPGHLHQREDVLQQRNSQAVVVQGCLNAP